MPAYLYPDSTSDQFLTKTGIQTITGAKTFQAGSTSAVPLTVKGIVSQTGNLQEWRNNAGTILARVESGGRIHSSSSFSAGSGALGIGYVEVVSTDPAARGIVVRGAASQTANLFEAQVNSGALALSVDSLGYLKFPSAGAGQTGALIQARRSGNSIEFGHGNQAGYASVLGAENGSGAPTVVFAGEHGTTSNTYTSRGFRSMVLRYAPSTTPYIAIGTVADANLANQTLGEVWRIDTRGYMDIGARGHIGRVSLYTGHPAERGLVIRGEASQTGNLTEWQDSAGNVPARVDANGGFFALAFNNGNNPWNTVREVSTDFNTQRRSGFYDMNNCTNAPTTDPWHHLIQITHGNGNNFMYQIVFTLSTQNNTMYTRQCTNGTWHAWRAI